MRTIETLATKEGRKLLYDIFHELRYEKQMSGLGTLILCWRLCTHEREIFKYSKQEVTIVHKLGFFSGTNLWMEEIVNRYYYSTINSFVYFGAAILLTLIGIRRFSDHISDYVVIGGVAFEALLLMLMFVVMFFTPHDSVIEADEKESDSGHSEELLIEIGELGRDIAAVVVQLEKLSFSFNEMLVIQRDMIESIEKSTQNASDAVKPNPEMIEIMKKTNQSLDEFKTTIDDLNVSAKQIRKEEIEFSVKKEIEKIITKRLT